MKKQAYLKEIQVRYKIKKVQSGVIDKVINGPETVVNLFPDLQNETKEKFITVNLDTKNKILCFEVVAIGNVKTLFLRPMEAFRTSIMVNANSVIVVHNHPSGDSQASEEDMGLTRKLERISADLGLCFRDHIIIGIDEYFSFAEEHLLLDTDDGLCKWNKS